VSTLKRSTEIHSFTKFLVREKMKVLSHRRNLSSIVLAVMISLPGITAPAQTGNPAPGKSGSVLYAELSKVPSKAGARKNPLEHDTDAVAAGGKLYGMHCAECHGATGEGGKSAKKGPSLHAPEVQQATPGALFWVLSNGVVRHGMPVWSKLPEPQRWQLVSYVKSLPAAAQP
jgi:mono/diheme cytochrome c family protein